MHVERAAWVGAQKCILYYINMHQGHSAAHPALQLAKLALSQLLFASRLLSEFALHQPRPIAFSSFEPTPRAYRSVAATRN